jgi:acyl-coenzyme A synthetase/AMP-(fatty) acid ligase
MVLLGKVPVWQATLTGLLKLGAIAIPCAPQLRAGDLKFRAEHSGSVAMVSGPEGFEEVEKMRGGSPGLEHFVSVGDGRDDWESFEEIVGIASEEFAAEDTASDEGAFLLYTSGTTTDEDRGSIVKAFVVLGPDHEPSEDLKAEIQAHCKALTAPYKYPRQIEFIGDLPKTASGKIRRVELRG